LSPQVAGDECRAEVVLVNPLQLPLRLDGLALAVEPAPPAGGAAAAGGGAAAAAAAKDGEGSGGGMPSQEQQQQGQGAAAAAEEEGGPPAVVASVPVVLPAGGKPVRVPLAVTPTRPGDLLITGVTATAWGVTWRVPLTTLPRLGPLTAPGALRPQAPQHVRVLPRLPLLRATLTGPDLNIVAPQEGPDAPSAAGAGAARPGAGGRGAAPVASPKGSSGGGGAGGGGALGKAARVSVFEGQLLSWTLNLSNVGDLDVGPISLEAVNARGQPLRQPGPGPQLPASFAGVHVDVAAAEAALRAAAGGGPLAPRRAVALPLALAVGRPPVDSFEEVALEVCSWGGGCGAGFRAWVLQARPEADALHCNTRRPWSCSPRSRLPPSPPTPKLRVTYGPATPPPGAEGTGRQLAIPLRFSIHPSLAPTAVRFLQLSVPLRDGAPAAPPSVNLRDAGLTRDTNLYRTLPSGRGGAAGGGAGAGGGGGGAAGASGLVRNSSEGALLAGALSPGALSPLPGPGGGGAGGGEGAAPGARAEQQRQMWLEVEAQTRVDSAASAAGLAAAGSAALASPRAAPTPQPGSPPRRATTAPAAAAAAAAASTAPARWLGVASEAVVELGVRNRSERYFRTWLARLPGRPGAEGAESAVVVLEPGDHARLLCPLLPAPPAGGGSGAGTLAVPAPARAPPARVAAGEALVEALGVRWEMITGDVAPDRLPRGLVRLAPVDAAHALTPGALFGGGRGGLNAAYARSLPCPHRHVLFPPPTVANRSPATPPPQPRSPHCAPPSCAPRSSRCPAPAAARALPRSSPTRPRPRQRWACG
jgi:hypothetical protein